jgi:aspartate aminotransferase
MASFNSLESPTLELAQRVALAQSKGIQVLSASTPSFPVSRLDVPASQLDVRLSSGQGDIKSRELIAARLFGHWSASPDDLAIVSGAKSALLCLYATLKSDTGKLVCITPAWPTYWGLASVLGIPVRLLPRSPSNAWAIDYISVGAALSCGDIVVLSNPCNPTGRVFALDEIQLLSRICEKADAWLILDESFSQTVVAGHPFHRHWPPLGAHVIVINSVSKNYMAQGWRLGAVYADRNVLRAYESMQTALVSPPATILQTFLPFVLQRSQTIFELLVNNRAIVFERLQSHGYKCSPSAGGFYLFPAKSGLAKAFAQLEKTRHFYVLDGTSFGIDDRDRFRLCLLQDPMILEQILQILEAL